MRRARQEHPQEQAHSARSGRIAGLGTSTLLAHRIRLTETDGLLLSPAPIRLHWATSKLWRLISVFLVGQTDCCPTRCSQPSLLTANSFRPQRCLRSSAQRHGSLRLPVHAGNVFFLFHSATAINQFRLLQTCSAATTSSKRGSRPSSSTTLPCASQRCTCTSMRWPTRCRANLPSRISSEYPRPPLDGSYCRLRFFGRKATGRRFSGSTIQSKIEYISSAIDWMRLIGWMMFHFGLRRREYGLERFVPTSLVEAMKRKELRKLLSHFVKVNQQLTAPGQKQLTALQAKLHYLKIISELPSYGAKCFSTNFKVSRPHPSISIGRRSIFL